MSDKRSFSRNNYVEKTPDEEEDDEWLFESIVAFLSSPMWTIPVQHFLETHCTVFSPGDGWSGSALLEDEEEDEELEIVKASAEHIQLHKKYKELVDFLINSFLLDLGISYNQFVRACKCSERLTDHPIYLELFEQVWCADNFNMFKAQMIRKNIELELQALILLQHQLGLVKPADSLSDEDEIMAIVIRKSKDEYDSLLGSRQRLSQLMPDWPIQKAQDLEIAKKLVKSEEMVESLKNELDQQDFLNKKIVEEELIHSERPKSGKKLLSETAKSLEKLKLEETRPKSRHERKTNDDDDDDDVQTKYRPSSAAAAQLANSYLNQTSDLLSQNDLEKRAEFMRKQRDILAEKKRQEREKQLEQFMRQSEQSGQPKRPMSSRAARNILSGAEPSEIKPSNSRSDEERKRLEARKALAETLKKRSHKQQQQQ